MGPSKEIKYAPIVKDTSQQVEEEIYSDDDDVSLLSEFENDEAMLIDQFELQFNDNEKPPMDEDDGFLGVSWLFSHSTEDEGIEGHQNKGQSSSNLLSSANETGAPFVSSSLLHNVCSISSPSTDSFSNDFVMPIFASTGTVMRNVTPRDGILPLPVTQISSYVTKESEGLEEGSIHVSCLGGEGDKCDPQDVLDEDFKLEC